MRKLQFAYLIVFSSCTHVTSKPIDPYSIDSLKQENLIWEEKQRDTLKMWKKYQPLEVSQYGMSI